MLTRIGMDYNYGSAGVIITQNHSFMGKSIEYKWLG